MEIFKSLFLFKLIITFQTVYANDNIWAVLVSGSNGWYNYRHQADICHAYKVLLEHGVPEKHIIVMSYDDIAKNEYNPLQGKVFNHIQGPEVCSGIKIDYKEDDVTPENFINVLLGEEDEMIGIGTGRVGPNDYVFVNFVDHGSDYILAFPDDAMLLHIEACYAGSMFRNILSNNTKILAMTAANHKESSYACYYDETVDTFLGDAFSVAWMEYADGFNAVQSSVTTSHVQLYGDLSVQWTKMAQYFGKVEINANSAIIKSGGLTDVVPSLDVPLEILRRQKRSFLDNFIKHLSEVMANGMVNTNDMMQRMDVELKDLECHEKLINAFTKYCFKFGKNPYAMKYSYVFANACIMQLPVHETVEKIKDFCSYDKLYNDIQ
ncbi:peptidase C13 family protein [Trichinella nativa]|uniref:Peptidase C13 family protein n=1 Tax=Trichinella nativa TaxID=6335 RepID=A0A1Y3E6Q9_9BILA|nr:peptidase C13 family protein [Trichinella nativa]